MRNSLARWARAPLVHFLLIGGVIFTLDAWRDAAAPEPLVISAERLLQLEGEWRSHADRVPDREAREALVEQAIEEELLLDAALARDLHLRDPDVRRRLIALGGFVGEGSGEPASEGERLEEALALDLHRKDAVVREHLIGAARYFLGDGGTLGEPSEADLAATLARQDAAFRTSHAAASEPEARAVLAERWRNERLVERLEAALAELRARRKIEIHRPAAWGEEPSEVSGTSATVPSRATAFGVGAGSPRPSEAAA